MVLMIKSDAYHDTWTNYLINQEPSLTQDQADGGGCCCCGQDKDAGRKKRWALQGHAKVNLALGTPCLGPMASRHDLLVIPKSGG